MKKPENIRKPEMLQEAQQTPLLVNRFILTKHMNREYSKQTFRIYQKKWRIRTSILGMVTITCGIILICMWPKFLIVGILAVLVGVYFAFMAALGYLYGAAVSFRSLQAFYGMPIEMCVEFYPQYFKIATGKGKNEFLYTQIMRRIELPEMSILVVGAQGKIDHGQIIDKRTFTPEELAKYYDLLEAAGIEI